SEVGARSIGLDLRLYKLFIFSVSAFLAGIGGALLVEQAGSFQFRQFQPVLGLFWFAAVVVAGVGSVFGAVLAGVLFVVLDVVAGTEGVSQLAIGLAALTLGLLPGGSLVGLARHGAERARASWERFGIEAATRAARAANPPRYRPTAEARRRMAAAGRWRW
ncbi:MAG: ABC transporter permease subunit, partial [Acidimicrobiales bacterium]